MGRARMPAVPSPSRGRAAVGTSCWLSPRPRQAQSSSTSPHHAGTTNRSHSCLPAGGPRNLDLLSFQAPPYLCGHHRLACLTWEATTLFPCSPLPSTPPFSLLVGCSCPTSTPPPLGTRAGPPGPGSVPWEGVTPPGALALLSQSGFQVLPICERSSWVFHNFCCYCE